MESLKIVKLRTSKLMSIQSDWQSKIEDAQRLADNESQEIDLVGYVADTKSFEAR